MYDLSATAVELVYSESRAYSSFAEGVGLTRRVCGWRGANLGLAQSFVDTLSNLNRYASLPLSA